MADKDKLDPLPPSDDEFWEHADVNTGIIPEEVHKGEHSFKQIAANEVQCEHCDWGFTLDIGDRLENGHVFDYKGKLII